MIWRRHDVPGHEACRIIELENGWRMTGASVLAYEGKACRLDYEIMCNAQWSSESALVREWVGDQTVKVQVDREMDGS